MQEEQRGHFGVVLSKNQGTGVHGVPVGVEHTIDVLTCAMNQGREEALIVSNRSMTYNDLKLFMTTGKVMIQ